MNELDNTKIAVIGLGYVGLPLAVEFSKKHPVVGFDINPARIQQLLSGYDSTLEVDSEDLGQAGDIVFTCDADLLKDCDVYIVTVPTPIDIHKKPDLGPLLKASETVGKSLNTGDVVIYESTVYPGATEEDCVPVLEKASGLTFNEGFFVGYSPERINPGDKQRRLPNILKVTSGSTPAVADRVDELYREIITAGTYKAESVRVAEACKIIENTQRDLNIALMNELAVIFSRMGIDTEAVLKAAETKWNFLPFRPGLVGGHCIGVDPYYLTQKAELIGCRPEIILAARRRNDGMGAFVADEMIKAMLRRHIQVDGARVLIMGITFKENCRDLRNTRVVDIAARLQEFGILVDVHDPWADPEEAFEEYGIRLVSEPAAETYDGLLVAVGHREFVEAGAAQIRKAGKHNHVLYDLKNVFPRGDADLRL